MRTDVYKGGSIYRQEYERGIPKADVKKVGKLEDPQITGTEHTFMPDEQIFSEIKTVKHWKQKSHISMKKF